MPESSWWNHVQPHEDICRGQVSEQLFAANLAEATAGKGSAEYADAATFFAKTYLTRGLRELLMDILHTMVGKPGQNPVANLQTSFGGGKTHTELAVYHLLKHPQQASQVEQVRALLAEAGVDQVPACQVAILPCSSLNPLGRTTVDGLAIRTLWGEMAYQLGGRSAFELVADNDAKLVSPGEETLAQVLGKVGACAILIDETLHYVDKVSGQDGAKGSLAKNTVAFLRELTVAVGLVPRCVLVISLTASRTDQLSSQAMEWLDSLNKQVNRVASARTPVEASEIYEIVRRRLFEHVNQDEAGRVAQRYRNHYSKLGGLPAHTQGDVYQQSLQRSYPFHPELIKVLYERWGTKPGFQLTRGTLRFLAHGLQRLWDQRSPTSPDLIQPGDLSLAEANLRGMVREVAGEAGAWESVMGSDVATANGQPAKAQLIDQERKDGERWAEKLATTILMYSLSGGENPCATPEELRLACTRPGVLDSTLQDTLGKLCRRLFYLYYEEAKYQFRKEPNVLSLQQTYHANMQPGEIEAVLAKMTQEKALGDLGQTGFMDAMLSPANGQVVDDNQELRLMVLGLEHIVDGQLPGDETRQFILEIIERHGQVNRKYRNTIVFCVADAERARLAKEQARDYLSWQRIQRNASDWERIGGAQQLFAKERCDETRDATQRALLEAYHWAIVPTLVARNHGASASIDLKCEMLGTYGPGKKVVTMAWERLTSEKDSTQPILISLTPQTLLERYGPQAWPEQEPWVTTTELWERFTQQVGLPILAAQKVLLDTLALGQREGLFALGHLNEDKAPRDQRDSYLALFFQEKNLPNGVPGLGQRWLVMRKGMYEQVEKQPAQVSPAEVLAVIKELDGGGQAVKVQTVYIFLKASKGGSVDDASFIKSLETCIADKLTDYQTLDHSNSTVITQSSTGEIDGYVSIPKSGPGSDWPPKTAGRSISLEAHMSTIDAIVPLYKDLLQPIKSGSPVKLTISVTLIAEYIVDPGGGFDATLAEGEAKHPDVTVTDSKK